jgi:hypothetical protein
MRWTVRIGILCLVLLAGYTAWPFVDLYQLGRAIDRRDAAAVGDRIEIRGIRPSISRQVLATYLRLSGREAKLGGLSNVVVRMGAALIDPTLEEMLSEDRLLDFFTRGLGEAVGEGQPAPRFDINFNSLRNVWDLYANSDYSFGDFYVSVPPATPMERRYRIHLHLIQWTWKLYGIELPEPMRVKLAQHLIEKIDKHPPR